jgi:YhcH/YjgK/YiaL family protein
MILDRLEYAGMYRSLGPRIAMALDYLSRTDFSKLATGRHEIDGDRVYAMVARNKLNPMSKIAWEAHRKYIDVQYIAEGIEQMGHATLLKDTAVAKEYVEKEDYALYETKGDMFLVKAGGFAIFAPHDIHAPGLAPTEADAGKEVLKVVVKCHVEGR